MAVKCQCSNCGQTYNLADEMVGKKVRCRDCKEAFLVRRRTGIGSSRPPREEIAVAIPAVDDDVKEQPEPAPGRRASVNDDDPLPSPPRRRKVRSKRKASGPPVMLIVGGSIAGVLLIGGIVTVVLVLANQGPDGVSSSGPQRATQGAQPPSGAGVQPVQAAQPATSAPSSGFAITLSNPQVIREFPRMAFAMDYRFDTGRPMPGTNYVWIIKSPRDDYTSDWHWAELSDQGTMRATGFEIHNLEGPYEMYIEERGPGLYRKRASNTVRIEKDALPADNGVPRGPQFGPSGPPGGIRGGPP